MKDDIFELLIPGGMEFKSGDLNRMSSLPWSDFLKGLEDYSSLNNTETIIMSTKKKMPVVGWLVEMKGSQYGEDYRIHEGRNIIGTEAGCDIVISSSYVSGQHAFLDYDNNKFDLIHVSIKNPTLVNDKKIKVKSLVDGDEISFAESRFLFRSLIPQKLKKKTSRTKTNTSISIRKRNTPTKK